MNQLKNNNSRVLAVIDMQTAFAHPKSEWFIPRYKNVEANVQRLVDAFNENVVWTKFVRDTDEKGAWVDYYDRWTSFRVGENSKQWDITLHTQSADPVISLPTFSKWGPEMAKASPLDKQLIVSGVATDCCVLSTVLGAVDAGRSVTIVTDACGAVSDEAQQQTLDLLSLLSPMVSLTTTEDLLASL